MAKKKSGTEGATKTARKGAVKKRSGASAQTAAKSGTPKAKKAAAPKATKTGAVKKKAGAVKLNERQTEILKRVHGAGEGGLHEYSKTEERTLDALRDRKLIKKGAKDKARGTHPFHVTKAGEKHLSTAGGGGAGAGTGA